MTPRYDPVKSPKERIEAEDLRNRFTYHPPKGDQVQRYEAIRAMYHSVAQRIVEHSPRSREQSLALTKLEEACMWTNAAIARHE